MDKKAVEVVASEPSEKPVAFTVEKGMPIPESRTTMPRDSKYPFRQMEVGDSFFVPLPEGQTTTRLQRTLASCAARQKVRVSTRSYADGVRVWRKA